VLIKLISWRDGYSFTVSCSKTAQNSPRTTQGIH
jgi:hypothetical protein